MVLKKIKNGFSKADFQTTIKAFLSMSALNTYEFCIPVPHYYDSPCTNFALSRDIECGEVLVIENPATACLYYDKREEHCDNCFKYIPLR